MELKIVWITDYWPILSTHFRDNIGMIFFCFFVIYRCVNSGESQFNIKAEVGIIVSLKYQGVATLTFFSEMQQFCHYTNGHIPPPPPPHINARHNIMKII